MQRTTPILLALTVALAVTTAACGDDSPTGSPAADATATLTSPSEGDRIAGGVALAMSAAGVTIAPAGEAQAGTGHFHVIADEGCVEPGAAIGKDADHVHVGSGASTGVIYLEPGTHSLCLQVGDGVHTALAVTDTAEIDVAITTVDEWCTVIAETDTMFVGLESSSDDRAVRLVGYENARRLLAQLADGVDVIEVDGEVATQVGELIHWATVMAETYLAAESDEAAAEQLWGPDGVLPTSSESVDAGAEWILDTCGVDL